MIVVFATVALAAGTLWTLRNLAGVPSPLCPGPYWQYFYFQIPLLIFPSVLALHVFGSSYSHLFNGVTDEQLREGSAWVIYGVVAFSVVLVCWDRLLGRWATSTVRADDSVVVIMLSLCLVGLICVIYWKSGELPILHLGDSDIGVRRKRVTTLAEFSPYYSSALGYLGYFGTAFSGHLFAKRRKRLALAALFVSVIALGWSGSKAPPVVGLLTFYFSWFWFAGRSINLRNLVLLALAGIFSIYLMFTLTMPEASSDELWRLLSTRLFLGQMSGFYQAISFTRPDVDYVATWVPFSRLLGFDQTPYARDLMLGLYGDTDTNGFLNSIFLQDAWGALGRPGLLLSPLLMATSVAISIRLLALSLRRVASAPMIACCLFSFLNVNTLTASFGQVVLFKALFFPLLIFFTFGLACLFVRQFDRTRSGSI